MAELTRDELHDLVWSVPGTVLAKRFGLSDVGFAKICARHKVPRPPRGYWAKKRAGKRVPSRTPLPALSPTDRELRTIALADAPRQVSPTKQETVAEVQKPPEAVELRIVVPDTLLSPHELWKTVHRIGSKKKGVTKTLRRELRESYCRKCYSRVLRSLDTLFKHFEGEGILPGVNSWQEPPVFVACVGHEKIGFQVEEEKREERRRKWIPPDERRSWLQEAYEFHYVKMCTGRLIFKTISGGWGEATSFEWKETEKQRLEDNLHKCVAGCYAPSMASERPSASGRKTASAMNGKKPKESERKRRRGASNTSIA